MRRLGLLLVALVGLAGCTPGTPPGGVVVVYTSVDDVVARPVCERFQKQTGIEVKLVPDTEETKSTGLLNRLIAEKARPVADVFWSGDPMRAAVLKAKGVSTPFRPADPADASGRFSDREGHWAALSARARVILYNTNLVEPGREPRSIDDFLDSRWKGKACLANPLFGTTSMHAAALFEVMGNEAAAKFFDGMRTNAVRMLSSNGEVKRRVAGGEFAFGLTDTDDATVAIQEGKPVRMVFPDADGRGTLIVPNAAVLVANGPSPENGRRFIDFLMTAEVEQALAESEAAQMPLGHGVPVPAGVARVDAIKSMPVDYSKLASLAESLAGGFLQDWVRRQ